MLTGSVSTGIFISQLQRAGPDAAAALEVKPLEELPVEKGSPLPAAQGPAAMHPMASAQQDARTRLTHTKPNYTHVIYG